MKRFPLIFLLISLVMLTSCGKKKEASQNMEQIQASQGVPVRVDTLALQNFNQELIYSTTLTGFRESNATAMLGESVTRINAQVGASVTQDQVIVEFPPDAPGASYRQASSAYENAKALYERMKNLYDTGGISKQDLDNARTGFEVAKANLHNSGQIVKVKAPISGVITAMNIHETDNVHPGDVLFTVSQTDRMKANIWVPESEIAKVKKGQVVNAIWNDKTYPGKVTEIAMAMNQDRKAFLVEAVFPNPGHELRSGITAEIRIQVSSKANAMVIERKLVQTEGATTYVYICQNDKAVKKVIQIGLTSGLQVEVLDGLAPQDQIITEGYNIVQDGAKVMIIKDSASQ